MAKQNGSAIVVMSLFFCLCIGSLASLPLVNVDSLLFDIGEFNIDEFDQPELDEEFLIARIVDLAMRNLISLKSNPMDLDFHAACLSPGLPPPKHS